MIPGVELAAIQAAVIASGVLDKTCTIQREQKGQDGMGHDVQTWTTLATAPCGLSRPGNAVAQAEGEELGVISNWNLQVGLPLPAGVSLEEGDRVLIGPDTFHVQGVDTQQSLQFVLEALIIEIQVAPEDQPNA
jgi:hypothetical protein